MPTSPVPSDSTCGGSLHGRRVVTTRDSPGRLDELLVARGATVVHVPLIEIGAPPDAGAALSEALRRLPEATWLVVTSQHGAEAVGAAAGNNQAGSNQAGNTVRLAAVGSRTAEVLAQVAGRPVDLVPARHTAADLVAAFPPPASPGELVVVAIGDLAAPTLADGLRELGYDVVSAVAYSTRRRLPSATERAMALDADAVVFASGSSAQAWAGTIGLESPPVVAIGPTTAAAARGAGLQVAVVAADHSLEGVVSAVTELLQ